MFAKLLLLIMTGALTATTLLTIRQQRIQAGHDMIEAFDRAREQQEQLWRLRAEIVRQLTPERVETMAEDIGELHPIPQYWCPPTLADEGTHPLSATVLVPDIDPLSE